MAQGGGSLDPDRIRPALTQQGGGTEPMWRGVGDAWNALSTLIAGIAVWGGIGYGIDRLAGTWPICFVVGTLVGNFAAIYLIYLKFFPSERDPHAT